SKSANAHLFIVIESLSASSSEFPVFDGCTGLRNRLPRPSFTTANLQFFFVLVGARCRVCLLRHSFAARKELTGIPFDLSFATIVLETPIQSAISLKLGGD